MNTVDTHMASGQVFPPSAEPAAAAAPPVADAESATMVGDLQGEVRDTGNLDVLLDSTLTVTVELGRAQLKFREALNLALGAVVELTRQTTEPVDILVNGVPLATGEVVVVDDHFAVRITKLLNRVERLERMP